MNRVGVGPPELFGTRPLTLSELRKFLQSSPPTRPAGDLNRMESEWDQLQSDASNAMGLYIFIICAYSYSRIFNIRHFPRLRNSIQTKLVKPMFSRSFGCFPEASTSPGT